MNKVIMMGRLTKDPEVRYTQGTQSQAVCRYSIAVNRSYKRDGEPDADFFNVVAFGARGEFANKYFKKGMQIALVGELRNSSYTDKNGVKRNNTDIIVSEQYFADSKRDSSSSNSSDFAPANSGQPQQASHQYGQQQSMTNDSWMPMDDQDDDLPF